MRARNIKPGIFKNEVLGTADPLLTILFEGLWCMADREGRLEDRPLRIKAEVFPYREPLDIHRYLTELARMGFVQRYESNGVPLIQVCRFKKHQNPHHTEKKSFLPAPVDSPLNNGEYPPDSLISDSLIPDSRTRTLNVQEKTKPENSASFNATEVAQILCQQNGWSGKAMIWALQAAIEFQAKRMPESELEQVGEWLLKAYSDHKSIKGTFAVGPQKFFEQGLYCPAADRREAKSNVLTDNPATRALAQMEAS
jgi:hypothetical protein